jgi:hypothetical protein
MYIVATACADALIYYWLLLLQHQAAQPQRIA